MYDQVQLRGVYGKVIPAFTNSLSNAYSYSYVCAIDRTGLSYDERNINFN